MRRRASPQPVAREVALGRMERLSALTHITASAEYLVRRKRDDRGGALTAGANQIAAIESLRVPSGIRWLIRQTTRPGVATTAHVTRLLAGVALLVPTSAPMRAACNGYLAATTALLYPRGRWGSDGSDQVTFQTQLAAAVARASRDPAITDIALWYVALQSLMSYSVSGWVKLCGESWRDGTALPGVMRTRTYGCAPVYRWSRLWPGPAVALTRTMLAAESLAPLVVFTGGRITGLFIGWAISFHASNALFMGLGRFLTAFTATHSAIAYSTRPPTSSSSRDSSLPAAAVLFGAITAGAGLAANATRSHRVARPDTGSALIRTGRGNTLSVRLRDGARPGPLLVFEAGLMSTSVHHELLRRALGPDVSTLTYARAGYGPSVRRANTPFDFSESVDDLADVLAQVAPGRRIVLVGHSLGGYLARRQVAVQEEIVDGIVYLDSMHPGQLRRSRLQRDGAEAFDRAFSIAVPSLRIGCGALLPTPAWASRMPDDVRARAIAEYRDARLWIAASREWRAARDLFRDDDRELPPVAGRALVISASETLRRDPIQEHLHAELGSSHRAHDSAVITGADHDSLLTDPAHVETVARTIRLWLAKP